ncbi:ribosomal RNA small subunit methyltransferase E [Aurantimicrobium sp. INA4]|uniref:16S rRNA (uracil(1498)-N(3))-methyltransferase n=1 Tax=Aurantimicrobium sp. INA4 TaxID=2986279 RepID=UPI0024905AEB|nr:16S rRNA (uracil(1498)-N(3))-methyltransferase [Aurantimicrobium sp. INA4]BDU10803.1 ribosomal RNA small subunit methyltransferase E [Aurantimicrobium sp. INA4]
MAHFYILESLESSTIGSEVVLDGSEGKHAATVSRVRPGETFTLGNGRGLVLEVEAESVSKDCVQLRVLQVENKERLHPEILLVQALAKTDRDERAIEAATELGVDTVIPWAASRSISKWEGPKIEKGIARWSAIVREASKQSIRPYIPQVHPPVTTAELVKMLPAADIVVLDPTGDVPLSSFNPTSHQIAIIVGPEGGITETELDTFRNAGATIVTMGNNILRTSTAGPAALAIMNAKLGRC